MVAVGQAVRGRASAVEQIGEQGAVMRPGDVLLQDAAKLPAKFSVMPGMSEGDRAGDHLAPCVALAVAMRQPRVTQLLLGFELVVG
jgi:hypothetical protein